MSALVDVGLLQLVHDLSLLPAHRLAALKRIAVKMENGFLNVDDVAVTVGEIQGGVRTYDEGLAALAAAH